MTRHSFLLIVFFVNIAPLLAQPPQNAMPMPRVQAIMPIGSQPGKTLEIVVTGTDLDDPEEVVFSTPGIVGKYLPPPEPPEDPKKKDPKKKLPGPIQSLKLEVRIAKDVPVGVHDLRIRSKKGLSNARSFLVTSQEIVPESSQPHNDVPQSQRIQVGQSISGDFKNATDVDYYVLAGKAGQRILANCQSNSLDSRATPLVQCFSKEGRLLAENRNDRRNEALLDCTFPADGDYYLRLSEFAYQGGGVDAYYLLSITDGPWIDAVYPSVIPFGQSTTVTLYGRNLPGGKKEPSVRIAGNSIESLQVKIDAPKDAANLPARQVNVPTELSAMPALDYQLSSPQGVSNFVSIYLSDTSAALEPDVNNDQPEQATPIQAPGDILGRIEVQYDKDWYVFDAKKGDQYEIELYADRIGSEMDMYLLVKNQQNMGNVVQEQDDERESVHPQLFFTQTGDPSRATFTAPADSKYLIFIGSRESNVTFGPRCNYWLRISRASQDFSAIVMPDDVFATGANNLGQVDRIGLQVIIDRRGGFNEQVTAIVEGLPAGVKATPAILGPNTRWGLIILENEKHTNNFLGNLTVKCSAKVGDKVLEKVAQPASITWPGAQNQNTPLIVRLDRSFPLCITEEKAPFQADLILKNAKIKTKDDKGKDVEKPLETPIFVRENDTLNFPFQLAWQSADARPNVLNVFLYFTMPNMTQAALGTKQNNANQPSLVIAKDKSEGVFTVDVRRNALPGKYQIWLKCETLVQYVKDPNNKNSKANGIIRGWTEPIDITVLPSTLAKVAAKLAEGNSIEAGTTGQLEVQIERQNDYSGEYNVTLGLPQGTTGVKSKVVKIPAGQNRVLLPIEVDEKAKVGNLQNVFVRLEGTVHEKFQVNDEMKLNINISAPKKKK